MSDHESRILNFQCSVLNLFLVFQIRVKYVEFVALDCFWGWVIIIVVGLVILVIPVTTDPDPIDVDGFSVSEPSFSFGGHPIIELFLIFLHSLVFFKLNDFFADGVIGGGFLSVLAQEFIGFVEKFIVLRDG